MVDVHKLHDLYIAALNSRDWARFATLVTKDSPFTTKPALHRPTTWLDPKLVVEVSFEDRTEAGRQLAAELAQKAEGRHGD
jgi:hypothetical protein